MTATSDRPGRRRAGEAAPQDAPTFLYDGDCGFCTSCARFLERWVPTPARILPWQFADLPALGVTAQEADRAVQWVVEPDGPPLAGPDAIAALLRTSRPWWRVAGWLLQRRFLRALAWPAYDWVARNRHRLPGGTPACSLPKAPPA